MAAILINADITNNADWSDDVTSYIQNEEHIIDLLKIGCRIKPDQFCLDPIQS